MREPRSNIVFKPPSARYNWPKSCPDMRYAYRATKTLKRMTYQTELTVSCCVRDCETVFSTYRKRQGVKMNVQNAGALASRFSGIERCGTKERNHCQPRRLLKRLSSGVLKTPWNPRVFSDKLATFTPKSNPDSVDAPPCVLCFKS